MINLFEMIEDQSKFSKEQEKLLEKIAVATAELCNVLTDNKFGYANDPRLGDEISELVRDKLLENGYITHLPTIYYNEDGTPYMEEYQNPDLTKV